MFWNVSLVAGVVLASFWPVLWLAKRFRATRTETWWIIIAIFAAFGVTKILSGLIGFGDLVSVILNAILYASFLGMSPLQGVAISFVQFGVAVMVAVGMSIYAFG